MTWAEVMAYMYERMTEESRLRARLETVINERDALLKQLSEEADTDPPPSIIFKTIA
jgi:hypothetical protein